MELSLSHSGDGFMGKGLVCGIFRTAQTTNNHKMGIYMKKKLY